MMPLILLGAGVAGLYMYQKANPPSTTTAVGSAPRGTLTTGAQPAQRKPFQNPTPPRVDNSNQPWYAGLRTFSVGPADNYSGTATGLSAASSIVQSISDIWGNLAPGSSDPTSTVTNVDSMPSSYYDSPDPVYDSSMDGNQYSLGVDTSLDASYQGY